MPADLTPGTEVILYGAHLVRVGWATRSRVSVDGYGSRPYELRASRAGHIHGLTPVTPDGLEAVAAASRLREARSLEYPLRAAIGNARTVSPDQLAALREALRLLTETP